MRSNANRTGMMMTRVRPKPAQAMRLLLLVALLTAGAANAQVKSSTGGYTNEQALRGAAVYAQYCVNCHGAHLQGESGPALTGQTLRLAYGGGTAAQLYDFISRQMPQDKPGSLTQQQYLDITAYILARNGVPAGNKPLTVGSLNKVSISAQRIRPNAAEPTTAEIVRVAPPVHNVYAKLAPGADVSVTDPMMLNAVTDEKNWLLNGRTYDNQRFSPLRQITAENVGSLTYQVNGEQYIAVAAGGNFQLTYPYGDSVAIFKLSRAAAADAHGSGGPPR
jgi:mono/diheme cytochrome c family protein